MKNWKYIEGAKTGNDTPWEYAHRKPKVINDDKTGAEEFFKKLSDDVKEREDKDDADIEKVGNVDPLLQGKKESDLKNVVYTVRSNKAPEKKFKSRAEAAKYADSLVEQGHFSVHAQKEFDLGAMRYAIDVNLRAPVAVDNKKTGNANLETSVEKGKLGLWNWYVHKDGTIVSGGTSSTEANAKEMARKALEKEKVGNKVGNQSPQERLNQDLSIIKEECRKKGISLSFSELAKELEKYGWDFNELRKLKLPVSVGNKKLKFTDKQDGKIEYVYDEESKDGHIYYDGKLVDTKKAVGPGWVDLIKQKAFSSGVMNKTGNSTWYEPRRMPFQPRSLQYAYEQAKKKGLSGQKLEAEMLRIAKTTPHDSAATESEMRKDVSEWVLSHGKPEDFVNNIQTGNSAQDDKFAYVMREFDEGKLKTPDGKVVTDPAQAKAIAYSESKKTENGLARARNAIKKS